MEDQEQNRRLKKQLKAERKAEKLRELEAKQREEKLLKRGEGSDTKPIRSEVEAKENKVLKPYLRKYQNVDENIVTVQQKLCPYQLVHEGGQFRMENPTVRTPVSLSSKLAQTMLAMIRFCLN